MRTSGQIAETDARWGGGHRFGAFTQLRAFLFEDCPQFPSFDAWDPRSFHHPLNALAPDLDPVLHAQLGVDPWSAMDFALGLVDLLDPLIQRCVGERAVRWRTSLPDVEARAVDLQGAAHQSDGIAGLLRGDEREHLA
jgi:hypothetical protein